MVEGKGEAEYDDFLETTIFSYKQAKRELTETNSWQ